MTDNCSAGELLLVTFHKNLGKLQNTGFTTMKGINGNTTYPVHHDRMVPFTFPVRRNYDILRSL